MQKTAQTRSKALRLEEMYDNYWNSTEDIYKSNGFRALDSDHSGQVFRIQDQRTRFQIVKYKN